MGQDPGDSPCLCGDRNPCILPAPCFGDLCRTAAYALSPNTSYQVGASYHFGACVSGKQTSCLDAFCLLGHLRDWMSSPQLKISVVRSKLVAACTVPMIFELQNMLGPGRWGEREA